MTTAQNSARLIIEMRSLAKDLFATGINALSLAGSGNVHFHPRMAQLACLDAVRSAAFQYFQTVLVTHSAIADDASFSASKLLELAEGAGTIDGAVAIVNGRIQKGPCNNRLALSFALAAAKAGLHRPWIFLSGTTGHREHRYHSAGALVDAGTCPWIWPLGKQADDLPVDLLPLLADAGGLLMADAAASYAMNIDLILLA
jgi:hypothetical protein